MTVSVLWWVGGWGVGCVRLLFVLVDKTFVGQIAVSAEAGCSHMDATG